MPEEKIVSEEVRDIVEQEIPANPVHETVHHSSHSGTHHLAHHESHAHHAHHKVKKTLAEKIRENWKIIFILVIIFLLAFGIRGHLLRNTYLFEFDAFYHARLVEQIVTTGGIISPDPQAYYEVAGGVAAQPMSVFHIVSAALYHLVAMGQPYDKETLMWVMQFFPVVFGAIISVLMYFLAKEVFNDRKVGLIAAFVAAVTPAFAYRTMAGAQGDNAFGFLFFVLGFIFFVRSVKDHTLRKEALINIVLAGVFFGLMSMTWRLYLLIPLIVIFYFIFAVVLVASREEKAENWKKSAATALGVKAFISMAIFTVMSYAYGEDWISDALSYLGRPTHLEPFTVFLITMGGCLVAFVLSAFFVSKMKEGNKKLFSSLVIVALYAGLIVMMFYFATVPDLSDRSSIGSQVGEEAVGNQFFSSKYNILQVLPWMALVLLPISLYLFRKEDSHTGLIFFFWTIITLFMAWYTLKFTFVLGFAISAAAAIVAYVFFEGTKRFNLDKGIEGRVIIGIMLLVVLLGVGASARFMVDYTPYVDSNPQWQETISWIKSNTPNDAKLFNWWDQGHILSFLTDRKVSTDNRNSSGFANREFAEFITTRDTNRGYEIASKDINADYIVLDSSMFNDAAVFEYYFADKIDSSILIKKGYINSDGSQNGTIRILSCSGMDSNSELINCGSGSVSREQWNTISDKWKSTPDEFQNGSVPQYYYRSANNLIILNSTLNQTNLAKAWLNSDETSKYYEIVYNKNGVMLLRIKR